MSRCPGQINGDLVIEATDKRGHVRGERLDRGPEIPPGPKALRLPVLHEFEHQAAVIQREDVVFLGVGLPCGPEPLHDLGIGRRKVTALVEVILQVVEFPDIVLLQGAPLVPADQSPAAILIGPVAAQFEILAGPGRGPVRQEVGQETGPLQRLLRGPEIGLRPGDAGGFEQGRHDVDDMDEFFPDPALVADAAGPGHDERVGDATEVGILLVEAERGVRNTGPRHRVVGEGRVLAHHIIEFGGLLDRHRPTERRGEDIGRSLGGSFAGSPIVGHDQDDGIVRLTEVAQGLHQPPDIAVHIGDHGGIDLHVAGKNPPLDGVQPGPGAGAEGQGRQAGRRR